MESALRETRSGHGQAKCKSCLPQRTSWHSSFFFKPWERRPTWCLLHNSSNKNLGVLLERDRRGCIWLPNPSPNIVFDRFAWAYSCIPCVNQHSRGRGEKICHHFSKLLWPSFLFYCLASCSYPWVCIAIYCGSRWKARWCESHGPWRVWLPRSSWTRANVSSTLVSFLLLLLQFKLKN